MVRRSGIVLLWAFGLSATTALACGPFFPLPLGSHREKLLLRAPWTSFGGNASGLTAPPSDPLEVNEQRSSDGTTAPSLLAMRMSAESHGLTQDQLATLVLARAAGDRDSAYLLAASLPDAVRSYTAGAVEYGRGLLDAAAARRSSCSGEPVRQPARDLGRVYAWPNSRPARQASRRNVLVRESPRAGSPWCS
jgi:cellulose synthase operon protein C